MIWLGGSFTAILGTLLILSALKIKLGQGYFAYLYSPLRNQRVPRVIPMIVIALAACGAIRLLVKPNRQIRILGISLLALLAVAAGVWNWWAPPQPVTQQMFNMTSFSTDGAFVFEARQFSSLRAYLRDFPQRLNATVEQMGSTRVLSNPPGMTIIARGTMSAWADGDRNRSNWLNRYLIEREQIEPMDAPALAESLRVGFVLTALWVVAAATAYLLGRVFLPPAGAAVFAVILSFNPCTVHFVPGKDPAQLLAVNVMLTAWLLGWRRGSRTLSFVAGAALVLGAILSLVQIWVAIIALAAVLWHDHRRWVQVARDNVFPAALGAIATVAAIWIATGWNVPLSLLAVARRWSGLQNTFVMNRPVWYAIGLPIFLLFLSPGLFALLGLTIRRPRLTLGMRLALCTVAVMLLIYFGIGLTYELPRLWVAFLPPLTLGLAIDRPLLHAQRDHPRVAKALMIIVLTQVVFTTLHWTIFDARETEFRLTSGRFYH